MLKNSESQASIINRHNNGSNVSHDSNRVKTDAVASDEICSLFRPEYIEFVRQLADMEKWFCKQMDYIPKSEEALLIAFGRIIDSFNCAVHNIGELVAYEFTGNLFFNKQNQN